MKILNIGSGYKKVFGAVNLDLYAPADVKCDLEKGKLPFKDNTFDKIVSYHCLEHIKNVIPLIDEMWRVTKEFGIIEIEVPYFASSLAHSPLDHVRFFTYTSFDPYSIFLKGYRYPNSKARFLVKARYQFSEHYGLKTIGKVIDFFINKFPRIYQRIFSFILPVEVIKYRLKVIK